MNNLKLIGIYKEIDGIFEKIMILTEKEKDNKKWLETCLELLKQIDRIFANAYENIESEYERTFIDHYHNEIMGLSKLLLQARANL